MADEEQFTNDTLDEMCWIQYLIEKYFKFYMTKKEIVYVLSRSSKINPRLIEIVWQKLEKDNKEFFRAYRIRLAIKDQIEKFNNLLEKQAELMSLRHPASASTPLTNGSQCHPTDDNSLHQAALLARPSENTDQAVQAMHNVYTNGASSFQQVYRNTMTNGLDNSVLVQSLNTEAMHGMNGDVIKSEQNTPETIFRDNSSLPECGNAFMQGPNSLYSCAEPMNGPSLNSSGLLRHDFTKYVNLSHSDLTTDFLTSNGVLENHYRSQFPDHTCEFLGHANQEPTARAQIL